MRGITVAAAALLAWPICAQGRVIWADDFNTQTGDNKPLQHRQVATNSGNDYVVVQHTSGLQTATATAHSIGVPADGSSPSPGLWLKDNSSSAITSVTVGMDRFEPFDTSSPSDRILHFQFDFRVNVFKGTSGARFVLQPDNASTSNLIIGFGANNILPPSGQELFFYAANGGTSDEITPTLDHAIGLNSNKTAFETAFNFGTHQSTSESNRTFSGAAEFGLVDFYRFKVSFDGSTYLGTVTRLNWAGVEQADQVASFSVTVAPVTLSSSDPLDRFYVASGTTNEAHAHFDNFMFSVTPEPAGPILLLGMAGLAIRRQRACNRRG